MDEFDTGFQERGRPRSRVKLGALAQNSAFTQYSSNGNGERHRYENRKEAEEHSFLDHAQRMRPSEDEDDDVSSPDTSPARPEHDGPIEALLNRAEKYIRKKSTKQRSEKKGAFLFANTIASNKYCVAFTILAIFTLFILSLNLLIGFFYIIGTRHGVSHRTLVHRSAKTEIGAGGITYTDGAGNRSSKETRGDSTAKVKTIVYEKYGKRRQKSYIVTTPPAKNTTRNRDSESSRPSRTWPDRELIAKPASKFLECVDRIASQQAGFAPVIYAVTKILSGIREGEKPRAPMLPMGNFLDIGAFDGIKRSVTYAMEECAGWNGVCLEPNPHVVNRTLAPNRPKCDVKELALHPVGHASTEGKCKFMIVEGARTSHLSSLADFVEAAAVQLQDQAILQTGSTRYGTKVWCTDLHGFLDAPVGDWRRSEMITRDPYGRAVYDLVSIHTVGGEHAILEGVRFNEFVAHVIVTHNPDRDLRHKNLMAKRGYDLHSSHVVQGSFHAPLFEIYVNKHFESLYGGAAGKQWKVDEYGLATQGIKGEDWMQTPTIKPVLDRTFSETLKRRIKPEDSD